MHDRPVGFRDKLHMSSAALFGLVLQSYLAAILQRYLS